MFFKFEVNFWNDCDFKLFLKSKFHVFYIYIVVAWKYQNNVSGCHRFQRMEHYQADDIARKTLLSHLKRNVSFHLAALYHVLTHSQGCSLHNLKMASNHHK